MNEHSWRELVGEERPVGFDQVAIGVASSDTMRSWSKGEVKNPETINYRTFKPEKGGLFCERIFGPTRDWECSCGKYKRIKHKGVICDRCGVEVTLARVRRERMGHIELAVPVSHIWFYKCMPSRLGLMLDMSARQLERVIYYEDYIVVDPGQTPLQKTQLLNELEQAMGNTKSKQIRKKLAKRLKLVQGFISSHARPEWMVLEVLPVIPPDLRPLVPLEGGRFATSDLNDLYRRVINRNNRLKNLLQLKTPEVIIRNEKRMLQEAVDALFDNGRHGRAVTGAGNRALKSLSDMLKGKSGRFRQNLLGKRVDYSGRSVIVIGPELKLHQCGLPKKMALVLFEPFIIRRLKELGYVHTVRSAKKMIERQTTEVWDILEEVTKGHPVLLNRAPTLHRLSVQAFEPQLPLCASKSEVIFAFEDGAFGIHDRVRLANPDFGRKTEYGDDARKVIETTVGRVFFSEIWPEELGFPNLVVGKSQLGNLIWKCYKICGHEKTVTTLDNLKEAGFREATRAGVSIGIDDMIIPKEKNQEIEAAQRQIADVERQYRKGVITPGERYNKIIDIWTHCTDQISGVMLRTFDQNQGKREYNPISLMVDSGARGNKQQVRQLAGLRGLMAKPSGDIIEKPILSNFREGLTVLEYFISTHGARKGLADTALKTADSGYMTRKLVDVAQDVIIREDDCGTGNGIWVQAIYEGEDEVVKLSERIIGRFACDDISDPREAKKKIIKANEEIDEIKAKEVESAGVEKVRIRSVLTCESKHGVCIACYGRNLATGGPVKLGEAVGIIAAQSIGEPGTQLTMRTFHIGGTASQVFKQPLIKAKFEGVVRYNELRLVELEDGNNIVLNKNGSVSILGEDGRELEQHNVVIGAVISVPDGGKVKKGETFVQWDPYNVPILSEKAGKVKFHDIIEGLTMKQEVDEQTQQEAMVVIEHNEDLHPQIIISDDHGEVVANYPIPSGAHIVVAEDDKIVAGTLMAKTPRKTSKTKDITGGLPRVAELFEARRPKDAAE